MGRERAQQRRHVQFYITHQMIAMAEKKILICDDDEGILDMMSLVLGLTDHTIILEKNSLHLYRIIGEQKPDLLLIDLWMPVLSGDQIVKTLKSQSYTRDIPIIVISASKDGAQIALSAGADDFLGKPFDVERILEKVNQYLG